MTQQERQQEREAFCARTGNHAFFTHAEHSKDIENKHCTMCGAPNPHKVKRQTPPHFIEKEFKDGGF